MGIYTCYSSLFRVALVVCFAVRVWGVGNGCVHFATTTPFVSQFAGTWWSRFLAYLNLLVCQKRNTIQRGKDEVVVRGPGT